MFWRHLARLGYSVVIVPYWDWDIRGMSADRKKKYLKGLLTEGHRVSVA